VFGMPVGAASVGKPTGRAAWHVDPSLPDWTTQTGFIVHASHMREHLQCHASSLFGVAVTGWVEDLDPSTQHTSANDT
jgi:hypothetical protein